MTNLMHRPSFAPQTFAEAMEFSKQISQSALVPSGYQGKPANCLVAIQWGMELGLQPLQALQSISVINGKPTIYGDALLAIVRADPRCVGVHETVDDGVATCTVKRKHADGSVEEVTRTFSMAQAQRAGLANKSGPWKQYPERMLQHRARGNALRDSFPDVLNGMITAEEANDYPEAAPTASASMKDITPPAQTPPTLSEIAAPKSPPPEKKPVEDKQKVEREAQKSAFDAVINNAMKTVEEGNFRPQSYTLTIPNKGSFQYETEDDFAETYNDLMLKMVQAKSLAPDVRRTKLKELEELNSETLATLSVEISEELKDKRLQYNKGLSVQLKEAGNG